MGGFSTAPLLIWKMTCYRAHKTLDFGSSYTNVLFFQDTACVCHPGGVHDVATTFFSPLLGSLQLGLLPHE